MGVTFTGGYKSIQLTKVGLPPQAVLSDPDLSSVSLLIQPEAGDTTAKDLSPDNRTVSANDSVSLTTSVTKWSNDPVWDFTDGYIEVANTDVALATFRNGNPWTAEYWIYPRNFSGSGNQTDITPVFGEINPFANYAPWSFGPINTGQFNFRWYDGSPQSITSSSSLSLNTWQHIAASYDGSTMRLFLNGTLEASDSITTFQNIDNVVIGKRDGVGYDGYLTSLRVTSNVARYTSSFSTPAAPFETP